MAEVRDRHGQEWTPAPDFFRSVVAIALVFRAAQTAVRRIKVQSYGANVITYLVAKLARDHGNVFDLDAVWDVQEVSPELIATLESWVTPIHSQIVTSAGQRNVTEWCKKEGCWDHISAQTLPVLSPAPMEILPPMPPTPAAKAGPQADTTMAPVETCCRLDAAAWANVMAWAATTTAVADFDRKVAHSVSGYALDGWRKRPSEKQATYAVRVIEAARRAGIVPPQ
jgi:hypothetical protein